jgi:hypothetical protein
VTAIPRAADLPAGSVVATADQVWTEVGLSDEWSWQESGAEGYVSNARVDEYLRDGRAQVLRVGNGTEEA